MSVHNISNFIWGKKRPRINGSPFQWSKQGGTRWPLFLIVFFFVIQNLSTDILKAVWEDAELGVVLTGITKHKWVC